MIDFDRDVEGNDYNRTGDSDSYNAIKSLIQLVVIALILDVSDD